MHGGGCPPQDGPHRLRDEGETLHMSDPQTGETVPIAVTFIPIECPPLQGLPPLLSALTPLSTHVRAHTHTASWNLAGPKARFLLWTESSRALGAGLGPLSQPLPVLALVSPPPFQTARLILSL